MYLYIVEMAIYIWLVHHLPHPYSFTPNILPSDWHARPTNNLKVTMNVTELCVCISVAVRGRTK